MKYGFEIIEYENGKPVPSAIFGDGTIRVSTSLPNGDGFTGVVFSHAPNNKTIGAHIDHESEGKAINEAFDLEYHLLFDNPDSIDVVIVHLETAKANLLENQG